MLVHILTFSKTFAAHRNKSQNSIHTSAQVAGASTSGRHAVKNALTLGHAHDAPSATFAAPPERPASQYEQMHSASHAGRPTPDNGRGAEATSAMAVADLGQGEPYAHNYPIVGKGLVVPGITAAQSIPTAAVAIDPSYGSTRLGFPSRTVTSESDGPSLPASNVGLAQNLPTTLPPAVKRLHLPRPRPILKPFHSCSITMLAGMTC